jgi:hypothetical protein
MCYTYKLPTHRIIFKKVVQLEVASILQFLNFIFYHMSAADISFSLTLSNVQKPNPEWQNFDMQLSERLDYIGLFTFRRDYRAMDYHSWARKCP